MTVRYQQTDATSVCTYAVYCSGLSLNTGAGTNHANLQTIFGGTSGTGNFTMTMLASGTRLVSWMYELPITNNETWLTGIWTVRLNVITANSNVTWTDCFICRVDSSCTSQATIASASSLGIALSTTGVKSTTMTGTAQTPNAGDKVIVVLAFTNSVASLQSVGIIDDQFIDSPFLMPAIFYSTPSFPSNRTVIYQKQLA
jgi:hypothetical protein